MAFPSIPTNIVTGTQGDASGTRGFPSVTTVPGDLVIALIFAYQSAGTANAVFSAWDAGWNEFIDLMTTSGSTMAFGGAYRWATGTSTGTFSVTQATPTGHAVTVVMSIPGAHATTPPERTAITNATSTVADPPALSPSWGADDTLWIVARANGETATTGSFTGLGTAPTNYTNATQTGISADVVGGLEGGVSFRQLNTASENVDGTTGILDTSNARNSILVIAVRPAPVLTSSDVIMAPHIPYTSPY